jgi:uncharacterized protein YgiM (DUF1202 family)
MYKKNIIKSVLSLILVLSVALQFNVLDTHAAATKTGWVSIDSGTLNIRSGPGNNYKVIGSLKNNTSVTVYSQSKSGWSEIGYNKKKAYVSSKYLRMYTYLMDKTKIYTYKIDGKNEQTSYQGKYYGWDEWKWRSDGSFFLIKEDHKYLYSGNSEVNYSTDLAYPLKKDKEWKQFGLRRKITSINGTLTTPAGTFKNVITVKNSDGALSYYEKNIGLIKEVFEGKTTMELTSLVNKK